MKKRLCYLIFLLVLLFGLSGILPDKMFHTEAVRMLKNMREESEDNRAMQFSEQTILQMCELKHMTNRKPGEILTLLYPETKGVFIRFPDGIKGSDILKREYLYMKTCRESYERVSRYYGAIWNDIKCFPVSEDARVSYENSWMFERNYGGERGHEGTDLMTELDISGHYQILSMTDGIVEKIGWLPLGGYRIGIRSPSGAYFYYAHLDSYARTFGIGDTVFAGEILGYMGDTGYGEEGTRGQFPVHLHLGIYVMTDTMEEISINPYWILRYSQYLADS